VRDGRDGAGVTGLGEDASACLQSLLSDPVARRIVATGEEAVEVADIDMVTWAMRPADR
jgi:hypothetical protein